ncbi:MAG TPA: hypothetical protein VLV55_12490 [Rhizomicrobium sp.]|nr:hypothetical protein [Rhizomicrobium sp.]
MSRHWAVFGSLAIAMLFAANAQAREGCGSGFHQNAYGTCVPNRATAVAPVGGVVAPVTGAAVATGAAVGAVVGAPVAGAVVAGKRCPVGYHMNANGVCRHN